MYVELDHSLTPNSKLKGSGNNFRQKLIDNLEDKNGLKYVECKLQGEVLHRNLLEYLEVCWASHHVVVISPDMFWYPLLCELSSIVSDDVEGYRSLFTDSPEKKEVVVLSDSLTVLPLDSIIHALGELVPTDVGKFLPMFSTSTENSRMAFYAAFADMVSPYYNYSMLLCGIRGVEVQGTDEDWQKLAASWEGLRPLFPVQSSYFAQVQKVLDALGDASTRADRGWWKEMFRLEKCGSGSQVEVVGWITRLYRKMPRVPYVHNFSSHLAIVNYKQLNTGCHYKMIQGLLSSRVEDGVLRPDFGFAVYEDTLRKEAIIGEARV